MYFYRVAGLALFTFALIGCVTRERGSGRMDERRDFSAHFISEALEFGARPVTTNDLPKLFITWEEKKDKAGIQVKTHRRHYKELSKFLRVAFGNPKMPASRTTDGEMAVYAVADIGVAIQVGTDSDGAFLVLVRGMTLDELFSGGNPEPR